MILTPTFRRVLAGVALIAAIVCSAAAEQKPATRPAGGWEVNVYLKDSELLAGEETRVVVEIVNRTSDEIFSWETMSVRIVGVEDNGTRHFIGPTSQPSTAVGRRTVIDMNPEAGFLLLEIECPYSPDLMYRGLGTREEAGIVRPRKIISGKSECYPQLIPGWITRNGDVRLRAIVKQGSREIAKPDSVLINVVPEGTGNSRRDEHKEGIAPLEGKN